MTRDQILANANACVSHDRNATYGDAAVNFSNIGKLWSAYLGVPIGAVDVGAMLALFKIARFKENPAHTDSAVDGCGYLALAGELATELVNQG